MTTGKTKYHNNKKINEDKPRNENDKMKYQE